MRKILCSIFILVSCQAIGQFHFRLYSGGAIGDIVTSVEETFTYDWRFQPEPMIDVFSVYNGSVKESCNYANTGRIGLGFKFNKNRFFVEFSPNLDFGKFTYRYQNSDNYTYFYDESHLNPLSESQISAYYLTRGRLYSVQKTKYDILALGLNFNLGFQISDRHSAKLFVCDMLRLGNPAKLLLYELGTVRYLEIYTTRSLGLSYEFMFAKNFCVNIQPSIPIKALDENREEYYMPIKRTPFVNIILGFQFPEKSERIRKEKYKPQIL